MMAISVQYPISGQFLGITSILCQCKGSVGLLVFVVRKQWGKLRGCCGCSWGPFWMMDVASGRLAICLTEQQTLGVEGLQIARGLPAIASVLCVGWTHLMGVVMEEFRWDDENDIIISCVRILCCTGPHFINWVYTIIQCRLKFYFNLLQILIMWSQHILHMT